MITHEVIDRFLRPVKGQALREGTRYAREARVEPFVGSAESVVTVVRGRSGDFEVALWREDGGLAHRCTCPSWRAPCKHEVAAALLLKQALEGASAPAPPVRARRGPAARAGAGSDARQKAVEERVLAGRREKMTLSLGAPPSLRVASASGFAYKVVLRGGVDGPHGCDCPDFEANRLHTCKHVERVRIALGRRKPALSRGHRRAAAGPRIYMHFGEVVEPRLFGRPSGPGSRKVLAAFDEAGLPLRPLAQDEKELKDWLESLGPWVEPEGLAWLGRRVGWTPNLPRQEIQSLLPPLGMKPYPYQWKGVEFLAGRGRALLADEMGLGKTLQAILAAAALLRAEPPARHVTIVCPASLRGGWQDEIRRWLGEEALLLEGRNDARARVITSRPRWLITHYEQVLRDHAAHVIHPPDLLIVDEAQRAKGLLTRTARVLKSIPSRYVFALTGTPLENRLEEAYAIAQLLDQRLLPPLWQIDRDHFVRDEQGRRVLFYRNMDSLRGRLAPAFLRRRKEDVSLQLPERVRSTVMVPMHQAVAGTYEDVMAQVVRIANKKVILPADLERMQRLLMIARRCCNGPHMLGIEPAARKDRRVPKLDELEQALRDLCLGEKRKVVVFSEWTDMAEPVQTLCRRLGLPSFYLCGDVPVKKRPLLIRSFSDCAAPAVFISTDAGGVGLNLQAADVVINLDLPWNPARLEQRMARVHRIGSSRTVQEILLVCKDSVEERILHLHGTKRNVLENVWSRTGEDVIAAPGGSGAFREMVKQLVKTDGIPGSPVPPPEAAGPAPEPATALAPDESAPSGHPQPTAVAPPLTVDPAALAAAMQAVIPAIPQEARESLAAVFQALAVSLRSASPAVASANDGFDTNGEGHDGRMIRVPGQLAGGDGEMVSAG
ncbi:MAG TPA: DEAD/DEAH box helicase [Candidatus Polarisedimenticolia bacterium]|nr:DEAD/DEAH box helicase [Candidatus Polarisedimenticolia bacterium]